MSAVGSKGRLLGASKELALKWEDTKNHWRDERSREFERKYLQELFAGHGQDNYGHRETG